MKRLKGKDLLDKVSKMIKGGAPIADIVKECGYTEMREDRTERLKFTDFYEAFLKEQGISIPSKSGKKAITMYAESIADAHLTVQRLTEEGADVISVCSIPDAEVLKFAIFAKFDPNFVNEAALWNLHNHDN